ncbi:MAG TPA: branched-chain amino acid transaminase [Chloroflexota bacterium]|nr:branched-chain amino acid transaminase [Chloroflexota bacterium]
MNKSGLYAYFRGDFVPLEEARVSVMTHALSYGTGVFEGIRGYWNPERQTLFIVKLREHYLRFIQNTRLMSIKVPFGVDELSELTLSLLRMDGLHEDVYIRPLAYKSSEQIGVSMEGVADELTIYAAPFGNYVDIDRGLAVCVSSWRRTSDNAIPPRAKVTGNYANTALIKNEAVVNGYDEAITLTETGLVSEGSAENLFIVRQGQLVTPSVADNILEGITRRAIVELATRELGVPTVERSISRSELYVAEEMFLTGTGAQIAPVTSVDRRPIGNGEVGPIAYQLQKLYMDAVHGRLPAYLSWLTPLELASPVAAAG